MLTCTLTLVKLADMRIVTLLAARQLFKIIDCDLKEWLRRSLRFTLHVSQFFFILQSHPMSYELRAMTFSCGSGKAIEKTGCGACLKTMIPTRVRHSRAVPAGRQEGGNPFFSISSGSPGQAGGWQIMSF